MQTLPSQLTHGREGRAANAAPVGPVQDVQDRTLLIRLPREIALPCDVIHELRRNRVARNRRTAEWTLLLLGGAERRSAEATGQVCCACAAIAGTDTAVSYRRKKDSWFCGACWHALPPAEVARLVQEVALRGVPL
jgi:hypothetical protein